MIVDLYLAYSFIKRLATPFDKWKAYGLGVIDGQGNQLIKRRDMNSAQKSAFGIYDLMISKLKKLLAKVPGGSTKLASYAAALWLIKEWNCFSDESMLNESVSEIDLDESLNIFIKQYFNEDGMPGMAAGNGAIDGIGIGPKGEPGLNKVQKTKYIKRNIATMPDKLTQRKTFSMFMGESPSQVGTLGATLAGEPGDPGMATAATKHKRRNQSHPRPAIDAI